MAEKLNIDVNIIPKMDAVDAALKKIEKKPIISKLPGQSMKSLLSRWGGTRYEKPPKTMQKQEIATGDPFAAFKREKTRVGKVRVDPIEDKKKKEDSLNKVDLKKLGKLWKLDLYWKWLKGTWITLTKYVPLLGKLSDMFTAAIGLILTALLMPFLPGILSVLGGLLKASAGFFKWTMGKKGEIQAFAELGFDAILAILGLSGIAKAFVFIAGLLTKVSPLFKILGDILKPVITWLGEKGLGGVLTKIIAFASKFINPLLWVSLIADIGKYIFGWIATWSDNPIWVAFWTTLSDLSSIVSEVADVFGWIVALFTGGIGDKVSKITGSLDSFDKTLRKNIFGSETGTILDWIPKTAAGGIVTSPQVRMVGEAGPEAIVPLDQMKGMGGTSITVSGLVDEYKFRSIIKEEIEKSNRRLFNVRGAVSI